MSSELTIFHFFVIFDMYLMLNVYNGSNMADFKLVNKGFNYSQDGPGNRLVYHLYGCNMRCPWCSNPEAMGAASPPAENAAKAPWQTIAVDEVVRQALSARKIFVDGGGVTFSGGEPTLQAEALGQALQKLRAEQIHTAVETNGTSPVLPDLFPFLSLLIIDVKHYDDARHQKATGLSNGQVLRNLRTACQKGLPVWVRTPLVNGFNAAEQDIDGFLDVYKTMDTSRCSFELLRYHEYGRDKWAQCGLPYTVTDGAVSEERARRFEEAYRAAGLHVIHT